MRSLHLMNTILIVVLLTIMTTFAAAYVAKSQSKTVEQDQEYELTRYILFREGAEGKLIALLKFVPKDDWKWNTNYPAKFEIKDKEKHAVLNKHIEQVTDKRIEVALEILIKKEKPRPFILVGSWSLCNDKTCKVYKREINF